MTRRSMIGSLFASAAASGAALVKPRVLKSGDLIGLITPASYVSDPDRLALAERTLKHFGLRYRFGRQVKKRMGYLGGTVEERVADIHDMFSDPEIKGIFCIRGGYGSAQLLDKLDYKLIARNPKVFLGYSDITSLHLGIHGKTGMVTFHGPVVLSRFTGYTQKHFQRALFQTEPIGTVSNPPDNNALRPDHTLRVVRPGRARGPIVAGNLSLIAATMGTPYEIDTRGKILCLEDVDEQPYSVDRMLTQLRLAGKLDAAAGIVFGECNNCSPREFRPSFESTLSLGEVLDQILSDLRIPVLGGLTIGHTSDQLTLPLGVMATLDADKGALTIEESGVKP